MTTPLTIDESYAIMNAYLTRRINQKPEPPQSHIVTMYYDNYERSCGDGFYPHMTQHTGLDTNTEIVFQKILRGHKNQDGILVPDLVWRQITNGCINGLDGDSGNVLLKHLNRFEPADKCLQIILSSNNTQIHPK